MNEEQKQVKEAPKAQPIWMAKSTVDGVPAEETNEVRLVLFTSALSVHLSQVFHLTQE